jgi:hypothetical protein
MTSRQFRSSRHDWSELCCLETAIELAGLRSDDDSWRGNTYETVFSNSVRGTSQAGAEGVLVHHDDAEIGVARRLEFGSPLQMWLPAQRHGSGAPREAILPPPSHLFIKTKLEFHVSDRMFQTSPSCM